MPNMLYVPKARSAYQLDCIYGTEQSVYGRESRIPIHDAIQYVVDMTYAGNIWCEEIGLCAEGGKLCVIYGD